MSVNISETLLIWFLVMTPPYSKSVKNVSIYALALPIIGVMICQDKRQSKVHLYTHKSNMAPDACATKELTNNQPKASKENQLKAQCQQSRLKNNH